uniref:Outer membrane protein/protective antigen OMA87 n=1 Tax=uncultured bacterium F42-01 TaxID=1191438 RepID=I3VIJ1_9BACT|nr:outer membrane protein/protective antigen OMA87 [uncultured bacterium F42-01]
MAGRFGAIRGAPILLTTVILLCGTPAARGQAMDPPGAGKPSKLRSAEDGWLDVSGFLDTKYGFLPIVVPITEPAVGYGAAGGVAFLNQPMGRSRAGYSRPDVTVVAGLGTANGTWGAAVGDWRHWRDGRLQTLVGAMYTSANLDFYGIGDDPVLAGRSLRYNLEPKGGTLQAKHRLGPSSFWAGLSYAFATTQVSFDAPAATPGLPDYRKETDVGGLTPSLTFDTRDNIFTPLRGAYVEGTVGLFSKAFGGDDEFQRVRIIGMQLFPLHRRVGLGFRLDAAACFGDAPFYLLPYISLRGAPALRYQGEEVAQIETEIRWQFWRRFSAVGFVGTGWAWNGFEQLDSKQTIVTGGTGFRYEIARRYGIHMGLDVAFGPDNPAIYVQVGSAWARP